MEKKEVEKYYRGISNEHLLKVLNKEFARRLARRMARRKKEGLVKKSAGVKKNKKQTKMKLIGKDDLFNEISRDLIK